ncbi:hypothetical protein QBC44DRAFT_386027 [Cladorrhinum sp. PSN332]|nr:hypothetical protein QBC44DRAFT_386027 [Cladorrhinum sp. PSN332]
MTTRKTKRSFSFSGSSPLTPARRIYDELEAGDSLSQSPAAKRAKRSGRGTKQTPYHPAMEVVLDEHGSGSEGSGSAGKDASLLSLSDSYNTKLAEAAGTEKKNRLTKPNGKNQNPASANGTKNEPSIFNLITIEREHQDTPTKVKKGDKAKKDGSPSKKKRDRSPAKAKKYGSPVKTDKEVRFSAAAFQLAQPDEMEVDNFDEEMDVTDAAAGGVVADGGDNRIPSPPLHSDHEPALPAGTRTLKAINKRLKSLDAKLSTAAPPDNQPSSLSEEAAAIQHLQDDVMALSQRVHRDEIRAQVRHQITFNSLKSLAAAFNSIAQNGKAEVKTEDKGKGTLQAQTLEHCLDKYMDDLGRASTTEEVNKFGKLCVKYAGDLFKTL